MGGYRSFGCQGLLKEKKKKAQIKILGTPLLLNFKILGGALPQTQDLIDACSLYASISAAFRLHAHDAIVPADASKLIHGDSTEFQAGRD